ncbi:MAG: EAL domain-containing protein [Alphaproteobacteria bacterium]|nr:EAL domain-containing protein [Alphaproteobacteria bacterium]
MFQPKVDLASQRMTGAEVFVRWQHPQYGLLPPGLFLDFVEANGRMADMTGFVFHAALDGARRWKSLGREWSVSINVAPGTVTSPGFAEGLERLMQDYGVDPKHVILEVPERAVAQEPDEMCEALLQVRAIGVHVALDGGGIVPVDLSKFVPMPFTSIKVGGPASIRLAQRLGLKGKGAIAARLRYARQYSLEAVAVGAEEEATMAGLADVGFTAAQGIWIQKPLPLEELLAWNGTWARGNVAMDIVMPVAPKANAGPARALERPAHAQASAMAPTPAAVQAHAAAEGATPVTKEDMQKALEAVRAKRAASAVTLQAKPEHKAPTPMAAVDASELEDILEDEEVQAPPAVKQQGFGIPGDACPPMKSLVQRRVAKAGADGAPQSRKSTAQDGFV